MTVTTALVFVVLATIIIGYFNRDRWGYYPSGLAGLLLVILVVWLLLGHRL